MRDHDRRFAKYAEQIHLAMDTVAREFRRYPDSYLYEADVQCRLFGELFKGLVELRVCGPARMDGWSEVLTDGRAFEINPVKAEYPDGVWFDIAILDGSLDEQENVWNQRVRVAIEIKLRQVNGGKQSYHEDKGKLGGHHERARQQGRDFTGISVVFCHQLDSRTQAEWNDNECKIDPERFEIPENGIACWAVTAAG